MIHLYDRFTMAQALTLDLELRLCVLLAERIAALQTQYGDLTDYTEFLIVEVGDTEDEIVRHVGFSPLVDPIDGYRWPDPNFQPGWDFLADRGGWFELVVTFGSTFAYVLLIADADGTDINLRSMCEAHLSKG
ncbi:hypothetical protein [uncultured Sphingomonas sp.]|uniref:hypothetical protein n=1 Tax=uncultured Sphingomonas sp. TaxID=158754 RepID=UPI0025D1C597|nr:hypothetical protein [uncultured Sphingomonas sp.]